MQDSIHGIDTEEGIRHCGGSAELYLRFLKRFPSDPSLANLTAAIGDGRMQDAYRFAHTFKGLTAQLGITALFLPASTLCALLRTGDSKQLMQANQLLDAITQEYHRIILAIHALP